MKHGPIKHRAAALVILFCVHLAGCATTADSPDIPEGATENTRTEANGDVITEYRVGAQLRMVKVTPARGPEYYLYDRDGDGIVDRDDRAPMTYYKLFEW